MKQAENLSILFWLRKNKKDSNNLSPLYCRITYNQRRAVFSTGIQLAESQFVQDLQIVKGKSKEVHLTNTRLNDIRNNLRDIFNELVRTGKPITAEIIREAHLGKHEKSRTLMEALDWHNKEFQQKVKSGNRAKSSLAKFETTKVKLKAFLKSRYNSVDLPLAEIRPDFADEFSHFLSVTDNLAVITVMKHVRNLKKIMLMCLQKE